MISSSKFESQNSAKPEIKESTQMKIKQKFTQRLTMDIGWTIWRSNSWTVWWKVVSETCWCLKSTTHTMKQAESWDMWNTILDSQSHHLPYPAHLRVPVESQHVQGVVFYILPEQRALPTGSYMYQTSGRVTSTNYGLIHMCVCIIYICIFLNMLEKDGS